MSAVIIRDYLMNSVLGTLLKILSRLKFCERLARIIYCTNHYPCDKAPGEALFNCSETKKNLRELDNPNPVFYQSRTSVRI